MSKNSSLSGGGQGFLGVTGVYSWGLLCISNHSSVAPSVQMCMSRSRTGTDSLLMGKRSRMFHLFIFVAVCHRESSESR